MSCDCGASCNDFSASGLIVGVPGTRGPRGEPGRDGVDGAPGEKGDPGDSVELLAELTDVTPVGLAVGTAVDARSARAAINVSGVNVLDFIPNPADTSSHNAGFQAAIDAAIAGGGLQINVPPGDWYITGLVVTGVTGFKMVGQSYEAYPTVPQNRGGSRLRRVGTKPVFDIFACADEDASTLIWYNHTRNVVLEDLTIYDDNRAATTPLIDLKGITTCKFNRLVLWRIWSGAPLLDMRATQDCQFTQVSFIGGGAPGLGAVRIRGDENWRASNAIWFNSCHSEAYFGPAVEIPATAPAVNPNNPNITTARVNIVHFDNHKAESQSTTGPHMYFGRATLLFFRACYFAFYKTTGPIVDCENVIDLSGDMSFFRVAVEDAIEPSSRLRLGDACSNVNLDVYTGASTPSEANVVQIDGPADPNIDVRVWGPSRRVNGRSKDQRHDHVASVFQRSTSANVNCQYIFAKSGLNLWSLGNPTNPSGDQQQFEILAISPTGNQVSMLRLKTFGHISGSDPSTANYREMAISAFLNLASTTQSWVNFTGITPPPAPVGGYRLYVNAFGNLTLDTAEVSMKGHKHSASDVFGAVGLADTPTSASSPGEPGDVSYGPDHFYVCVAPNTWKRATITSW